ncbi:MAG: ABC transporter ATP-binding protein, partial [Candidatus Dadabacteria bacterium]|nr:ABC transporter ATP-binding protein [Candidatus Dadabacteria bacterium]NIV42682.1 ATP-binding cassette domain-containing protein [Candidatus Dadabacteria bacterium]NIX15524.1 ATP-binding cassette domain-containing protein [Candidatus Dadabacteria bacterium]
MNHILRADNLNFSYLDKPVLSNINVEIKQSEITYILGANGAGKSTLLKILCGIISPQSGNVFYEDRDIKQISRSDLAKKIAYVSQQTVFGFPFTVKEVVLLGRSPYIGRFEFERDEDLKIAESAMEMVGISNLQERSINKISGGERQLVSLARAIAQRPQVMILDEPGTFLDLKHKSMVFSNVKKLSQQAGMTILVATHDISSIMNTLGTTALLKNGEVLYCGKSEEILTEQNLSEVYDTDVKIHRHNSSFVITA